MAEVVGVVASGIAVTQAAQIVGKAALSLSSLWSEVKDVPEKIQNLLDELKLAGDIIATLESDSGIFDCSPSPNADGAPTTIQRLAIQQYRQIYNDLNGLVNDVSADIASSKRRKSLLAKAKVTLKKDTLQHHEKRLEKAQRFLSIAIQMHTA